LPNTAGTSPPARRGDLSIQAQLLELAREARHQMERILGDMREFAGAVEDLAGAFNTNEIQIIRKGSRYTRAMAEKMLPQILMMARALFDRHPRATRLPPPHELPNTFLFRTALCVYVLLKRWISVGGAHQAKPEKLRNDMVDVNFAVFATCRKAVRCPKVFACRPKFAMPPCAHGEKRCSGVGSAPSWRCRSRGN
jgi:hypothetical protein